MRMNTDELKELNGIIGSNIKKLRLEKGLTLKELSKVLGLGYSNLGKLERNETIINTLILLKISYYFQIKIDTLFDS